VSIVIAGGTGFLGEPLADALARSRSDGKTREIIVLTRRAPPPAGRSGRRFVTWTPDGSTGPWKAELEGAEAVVNLAGEPIAGRRWSAAQKQRILDSRVLATRSLVHAILEARRPPGVLVSQSGAGYYGLLGDEVAAEDHPPGHDFLAKVCVAWEAEAASVSNGTRLVILRTGLVLERDGGALPRMLLPFRLGAGGPVGSGRQYWPWIHRLDWIELMRFLIDTPSCSGPFNASAPNPVTNKEFARVLGKVLHRPSLLTTPGFVLKIALGEMAESLLLSGQRAVPANAMAARFQFRFTQLDQALQAIFAA
jgi:uncharacterized protein (TIGR01777 family)